MYNYIHDINMSDADILWNKKTPALNSLFFKCTMLKEHLLFDWPLYQLHHPPPSLERCRLRGSEVNKKTCWKQHCVGHCAQWDMV